MGRKAVAARVKDTYDDGNVLYAWRVRPGGEEVTGSGPGGEANLLLFRAHVLQSWEGGTEPKTPRELLGVPTSEQPVTASPPVSSAPTLREWIGDPAKRRRGGFFSYAKAMNEQTERQYQEMFRLHGAYELIGDKPIDQVTVDDAALIRDRVLRCTACRKRALLAEPLGEWKDEDFRVDRPPFNGPQKCPQHLPERLEQRTSVEKYFSKLRAAFNAAVKAQIITANPFRYVTYGDWEEPTTNDDLRVALSHAQLDTLTAAHPVELTVVPVISVAAMLRREEMWGLCREDFPVPPEDPIDDPSTLTFQLSRVWDENTKTFRPWGKTPLSLSEPITIGADAVAALNHHLRECMQPSLKCDACRRGERIWRGELSANPHSGCGFANNAPLVPWELCTAEYYSKKVTRRAQKAAGLGNLAFEITHNSYRATGAVQYLDAGVRAELVVKMGRWRDIETLMKHYHRPNLEHFEEAANLRHRARAAELGIDVSDDAPVLAQLRFLRQQVEALTNERDSLGAENAQLRLELGRDERKPIAVIERVPLSGSAFGKWDAIRDQDLRTIIPDGESQTEILRALGLSTASKNYNRLRAEAVRLKIALPERYPSKQGSIAS